MSQAALQRRASISDVPDIKAFHGHHIVIDEEVASSKGRPDLCKSETLCRLADGPARAPEIWPDSGQVDRVILSMGAVEDVADVREGSAVNIKGEIALIKFKIEILISWSQ